MQRLSLDGGAMAKRKREKLIKYREVVEREGLGLCTYAISTCDICTYDIYEWFICAGSYSYIYYPKT